MKHFISLILMVIFYQSYAQDMKWYVKNNQYLVDGNTPSYSDPIAPPLGASCSIKNVSHPFRNTSIPYEGVERNDFFIIFADGNHFNSRNLDGTDWIESYTPNTHLTSGNKNNYFLRTNNEIKYLYVTKLYEGGNEDPDAFIVPNTFPPANEFQLQVDGASLPLRGSHAPPVSTITANHSPVPGSDMTLILDHENINKECNYKLCYDIEFQNNTAYPPNTFTPVEIEGSAIFENPSSFIASGTGTTLYSKNNQFIQNCTDTIFIDGTEEFTYINLYIPKDPDSIISDSPLTFELIPLDGDYKSHSFQDTIGNSHDPNYVEVLCVNQPATGTTSTIQYHAQCMNDGTADQPNPSIEFTFPFNVTLADITVTNSSIAYLPPFIEFNNQAPTLTAPSTNRVKFQFTGTLDNCPIPSERDACIAWVEFCVKVKNDSINVLRDDLMPFDRNTNFGNTAYAIERYIDLPKVPCEETTDPNDPRDTADQTKGDELKGKDDKSNLSKSNKSDLCRISTDCDCTSKISQCCWYSIVCNNSIQWTKIYCLLIFFFLLFLLCCLSSKFRRSKRKL